MSRKKKIAVVLFCFIYDLLIRRGRSGFVLRVLTNTAQHAE